VLEEARQRKEIGNALSAHVSITAPAAVAAVLERHTDELAMWLITSSIAVHRGDQDELTVTVRHADGDKCPRCWRFVTETATSDPFAGLCLRCVDALGATTPR
jgi:isoleucyl-tRNA synthetase